MKKQIIQILVLIFILVTVWYLVWNNIDFLTTDKGKNICTTILALFLIVPVIYGYIKSSNTLAKYKKELIKMYGDDIKLNNFPQNDFEGFKNFKNIHF